MAAKAGIFDLIFKSGAKAVSKGAGSAAKMPKKAAPAQMTPPGRVSPNVKVLPGEGRRPGTMGGRYTRETGRPPISNGRPYAPIKKAVPAKKAVPSQSPLRGTTLSSRDVAGRIPKSVVDQARKAEAANKAAYEKSVTRPTPAKKAVPAKKSVAAAAAKKAAYEKMVKKPVPVKKAVPVKKTQPYVSKPSAPAFKEPGGRTNRPTMGLKKYPPTKKPR